MKMFFMKLTISSWSPIKMYDPVDAQEEVGVAVARPSCHLCILHLLDK